MVTLSCIILTRERLEFMMSDSEYFDLFSDSDVGTDTGNLLCELHELGGINTETGSPTIIPPTPKRKRTGSSDVNDTSITQRLFANTTTGTEV